MLIKDAKKKLIEGLIPLLSEHGFEYAKNKDHFRRSVDNNSIIQIFDMIYTKINDEIHINIKLKIIVKEIRDIFIKNIVNKERQVNYQVTLNADLFKIIKMQEENVIDLRSNTAYLVKNDEDIQTLIRVIPKRFIEYVLPFYERNSSIDAVDKLLNDSPREFSIYLEMYPIRAGQALIAAKLNNNPRLEELKQIYLEKIEKTEKGLKEDLISLISAL